MTEFTMQRRRIQSVAYALFLSVAHGFSEFGTGGPRSTVESLLPSHKLQRQSATELRFRRDDCSLSSSEVTATLFQKNFLQQEGHRQSSQFTVMPTWLSIPRSHLHKEAMTKLRKAMLDSFFSENEVMKLNLAIEEAADGDQNRMAGIAELLLILVETMEMGLDTLIAAAYHYCSCVSAREEAALLSSRSHKLSAAASWSIWERHEESPASPVITAGREKLESNILHKSRLESSPHAMEIAQDAARLKKLEMVYTSISRDHAGTQAFPNHGDMDNLRKLLLTETKHWRALAIRLAACLYRLRGLERAVSNGTSKTQGQRRLTAESVQVAREALHIYAPLASQLGMQRLKNELETVGFRTLYRRQYSTVMSLANQVRQSSISDEPLCIAEVMKEILGDVMDEVRTMLRQDPVFSSSVDKFSVMGRVKEPYSMWKKMLKKGARHILEIPDALALRVVLDSKKEYPDEDGEITRARDRALCFYVQELCKKRWAPLEGNPREKNYIDNPKPNTYQSLHYTAAAHWKGEEWNLEIQVRSGEMHKAAEFGLASHWDYKSESHTKNHNGENMKDHSSNTYIEKLREWHWQQKESVALRGPAPSSDLLWSSSSFYDAEFLDPERADRIRERTACLEPYIKALNEAKADLALDDITVFLIPGRRDPPTASKVAKASTSGQILHLPSGSCVVDALREGERRYGVKLNGWRHLDSAILHNGQHVTPSLTGKLSNGDVLTIPYSATNAAVDGFMRRVSAPVMA